MNDQYVLNESQQRSLVIAKEDYGRIIGKRIKYKVIVLLLTLSFPKLALAFPKLDRSRDQIVLLTHSSFRPWSGVFLRPHRGGVSQSEHQVLLLFLRRTRRRRLHCYLVWFGVYFLYGGLSRAGVSDVNKASTNAL